MAVTSMASSSIRDFVKYRNMATSFGAPPYASSYLVIGGGAGGSGGLGGSNYGSGGGAGIARTSTISLSSGSYTLTVGGGGAGGPKDGVSVAGSSSVFSATATGGNAVAAALRTGGINADYSGGGNPGSNLPGGGAGAGGNGSGMNGGTGIVSSITGTSVTRGGGGGGGSSGTGGSGGGGTGTDGSVAGGAGTVNTGSGGGGGFTLGGGAGGSGVVIFTLPVQAPLATFSGGVTQTNAIVGNNRVYTVTATSTTSETVTIS